MPESEPMAFVQGMILQIRKHIPESGYLRTEELSVEINRFRIRIRLPNDSNGSSPVNNTTDHWLFDAIIAHPNP